MQVRHNEAENVEKAEVSVAAALVTRLAFFQTTSMRNPW